MHGKVKSLCQHLGQGFGVQLPGIPQTISASCLKIELCSDLPIQFSAPKIIGIFCKETISNLLEVSLLFNDCSPATL